MEILMIVAFIWLLWITSSIIKLSEAAKKAEALANKSFDYAAAVFQKSEWTSEDLLKMKNDVSDIKNDNKIIFRKLNNYKEGEET